MKELICFWSGANNDLYFISNFWIFLSIFTVQYFFELFLKLNILRKFFGRARKKRKKERNKQTNIDTLDRSQCISWISYQCGRLTLVELEEH